MFPLQRYNIFFSFQQIHEKNNGVLSSKHRCRNSKTTPLFQIEYVGGIFVPSRGNTCRLLVVTLAGSGMVQLQVQGGSKEAVFIENCNL